MDVLSLLLEANADQSTGTLNGLTTPLSIARSRGHIAISIILTEYLTSVHAAAVQSDVDELTGVLATYADPSSARTEAAVAMFRPPRTVRCHFECLKITEL